MATLSHSLLESTVENNLFSLKYINVFKLAIFLATFYPLNIDIKEMILNDKEITLSSIILVVNNTRPPTTLQVSITGPQAVLHYK